MLEGACRVANERSYNGLIRIEHAVSVCHRRPCRRALVLTFFDGVTCQIRMNIIHVVVYLIE